MNLSILWICLLCFMACAQTGGGRKEKVIPFSGTIELTEKNLPVRGSALLNTVRTARHDGFDRVVFEFLVQLPSFRLEYVRPPLYQCGSGDEIPIRSNETFQVRFHVAQAHDESGKPSVSPVSTASLVNIDELRIVCDYEGEVIILVGLRKKTPYRMMMLQNPERLVLDFQHGPS